MGNESYFEDIQKVLINRISKSQVDIKIAVAFFTDHELINILAEKAKKVKVELIIADNDINKKIDYSILNDSGVDILWYRIEGKGSMHNKFCIIDEKLLITGSYNWTVNARNNNKENILIIKDIEIIKKFLANFSELKKQVEMDKSITSKSDRNNVLPSQFENSSQENKHIIKNELAENFEAEWNMYLNSNVLNYDREELRTNGIIIAEKTQGNPEVISQYLDTIYQDLLSDTEVEERELELLKSRLEQRITYYKDKLDEEASSLIHIEELNKSAKDNDFQKDLISDKNYYQKLESKKESILKVLIPTLENDIKKNREEIEELQIELIPPPLKKRVWFEVTMLSILSLYLFVFYSSVIYTILYGKQDAIEYMNTYGKLPELEVFNGEALSFAFEKSWTILIFISLFTILPFVFGYLFHQLEGRYAKWAYITSAIIMDALLAYLITKNVFIIDYQAGLETEMWNWSMAFFIARFWVVLFLGAVPYLAWGALLEYIWDQFDKRSLSELHYKKELKIEQMKNKIKLLSDDIANEKNKILDIEEKIIEYNGRIQLKEKEIMFLEYDIELKKHQINKDINLQKQTLLNQKEKIMTYLLNKDRIPVSYSSLKDRINIFLSGWNEWLYDFYASKLANEYVNNVNIKVKQWLESKRNELES